MAPPSTAVNIGTVALEEWLVAFEEGKGTGWSANPSLSSCSLAGEKWLYDHFLADWGTLWTGAKADLAMWREDAWQRPTAQQLYRRLKSNTRAEKSLCGAAKASALRKATVKGTRTHERVHAARRHALSFSAVAAVFLGSIPKQRDQSSLPTPYRVCVYASSCG